MSEIDTYFQAWNETDATARRALLEGCMTADAELIDPTGRFRGVDGVGERIGGFHESSPGALVVKSSGVDQHNGLARYSWDIVDPHGNTVLVGLDVAEREDDGRLRRVLMFFGPLPTPAGSQ
jgi:SnoaL-like domain